MLIYFSASARTIQQDITVYRKIIASVRKLGHSMLSDWTEITWLQESQNDTKGGLDWFDTALVEDAKIGIEKAELIIAEVTGGSSFGVGYEVATALRLKKPVLILIDKSRTAKSYATGIDDKLATVKFYKRLEDIDKIVSSFIKDNTVNTKDLRFNFVIDRQIHNHLRWRAFKSGKTKAEVVRDLLAKDMNEEK